MTPRQLFRFKVEASDKEKYVKTFHELDWCFCGQPEDAFDVLRVILRLMYSRSAVSRHGDPRFMIRSNRLRKFLGLSKRTIASGMATIILYNLDANRLTEHGGSVSGSWLTAKGEDLMFAMYKFGLEGLD